MYKNVSELANVSRMPIRRSLKRGIDAEKYIRKWIVDGCSHVSLANVTVGRVNTLYSTPFPLSARSDFAGDFAGVLDRSGV